MWVSGGERKGQVETRYPVLPSERAKTTYQMSKSVVVSMLPSTTTASVRSWLETAHPGTCGTTSYGKSCRSGASSGSFLLPRPFFKTWSSAALHCLQKCADCPRCHYISVNIHPHADCSWYTKCDTSALTQPPPPFNGFLSAHVPAGHKQHVAQLRDQAGKNLTAYRYLQDGSANPWLRTSHVGVCGNTSGMGDCMHGMSGILDMPYASFGGWWQAADACLWSCAACERCKHISVSLLSMDCSWFYECNSISATTRNPADDFRSGRALVSSKTASNGHSRISVRAALSYKEFVATLDDDVGPQDAQQQFKQHLNELYESNVHHTYRVPANDAPIKASPMAWRGRGLLLVTASFPDSGQISRIEHCLQRLRGAIQHGLVTKWYVVEDSALPSPDVSALLKRSGVPHVHLSFGPTHLKGNAQRNFALEIIRDTGAKGVGKHAAHRMMTGGACTSQ